MSREPEAPWGTHGRTRRMARGASSTSITRSNQSSCDESNQASAEAITRVEYVVSTSCGFALKALTRAATKTTGKRFLYARALLLCDRGPEGPGWTVARVAEALGVSARTIERNGGLWSRVWSSPWSARK